MPGLVAVEGVEPPERVRHQVAADRRALGRPRHLRPASGSPCSASRISAGRWKPPVTTTTGRSPASAAAARIHAPCTPRGPVSSGPAAVSPRTQVEVRGQPLGQPVGRLDLEQVVPERVHVVHGERAAQPSGRPRRSGPRRRRTGCARSASAGCQAGRSMKRTSAPAGTARGQRRPTPGSSRRTASTNRGRRSSVAVAGEDRDRQLVAEQQLVEPVRSCPPGPRPARTRAAAAWMVSATSRAQAGLWCRTPRNVSRHRLSPAAGGGPRAGPAMVAAAPGACCSR